MTGAVPTDLGTLEWVEARTRTDLLADPVAAALARRPEPAARCAPIDPDLADTAAFCAAYGVPMSRSANCVLVSGRRDGVDRWAAVVVLATTRAEINTVVRRWLDVRKVSFADQAEAVAVTGMEYGGITPVGLPPGWPVLVDDAVVAAGPVVIGSGLRGSKLQVVGADLRLLPGAVVVPGLARPRPDAPIGPPGVAAPPDA